MRIRAAELDTPIGVIEVALREDALCAVKFEGGRRSLQEVVAHRFGEVEVCSLPAQHEVLRRLRDYFAGEVGALDSIQVDTAGTALQRAVWRQLRRIPAGETASYRDVAVAIGAPTAVRAVGAANGANPVGIVVPCHRVVRSTGHLGGYGGGLDRKRWLLEHERRHGASKRTLL
jgi:methylated-DNA-[protein]-cysteine S-methyltransferase